MLVTLILGLLCVLFNLMAYFKKSDWGLKLSCVIIFIFLGLRYNFGNDYETYIKLFNRVHENGDIAFDPSMYLFYEPGWMMLNWIFRPVGFFGMTLALSLFYSVTVYKLIKKYIPYQYYWITMFFIVFNPGFLLVHSSAMRQTVAILIFLLSINFIISKRVIPFILCILFASTFHYTSLVILIISPILFDNRKISFVYGSVLFFTYLMFFILGSYLLPYILNIVSLFSEKYESYSEKGTANSGLGFLFYTSLFLLTLVVDKYQDKKITVFFKAAIVYFMLMPFTLIIEMTARIGMYFSPSVIIVYPFIFKTLKLQVYKSLFLLVLILFTIYQFFQFFYSETYKDYFMDYHTFFSSPQWN
jgi:hypothetical protein